MQHYNESKSSYGILKFENSLARNMFSWSNMDYYMVDEPSKVVNENVRNVQD